MVILKVTWIQGFFFFLENIVLEKLYAHRFLCSIKSDHEDPEHSLWFGS